jgi:predicted hydrocarbon binding protein
MVLLPKSYDSQGHFAYEKKGVLSSEQDGRRVVAVDIHVWSAICRELYSENPSKAPVLLERLGQEFGADLAQQARKSKPSRHPLRDIMDYLSDLGWGEFRFNSAQANDFATGEGDTLEFNIRGSVFKEVNLGGSSPLCHFVVGMLKGVVMTLKRADVRAWEEKCESKGDDHCSVFVRAK